MLQKPVAVLLGIWLLGSGISLRGLDPAKEILQYNLEVYTTEDGLPQSSVLTMVQTRDGYLWLGTYEGVARFDGIRFQIFDTANTPEMASNRIKALLEDNRGNLWIGTSGGLLCYRSGTFTNYTVKDGLSDNFVLSLCQDRQGRLWVGTTDGLNCFEGGRFSRYGQGHGLARTYISALAEDGSGSLWIGTSGGGLHLWDADSKQISRPVVEGWPRNVDIRTLYRDRQGRIWIGTAGRGLAVTGGGAFRIYTRRHGLSGDDIRAIFEDSNGSLWIGTNGQGINRLKNGTFSYSDSDEGLFSSPIRSILEDREGSLWIGSRDGLTQLMDGKFVLYNRRSGLPVDSVRTVFQDRSGTIWVGTVNGGLGQFENGRFKTFGSKEGFLSEHIWTITQGGDDSLWVGTYGGGLHRFKNDRVVQIYNTRRGLSNNIIRALFVDNNDHIWVGTNGGGVDVIDPQRGTIVNYRRGHGRGLSDDFIYAIGGDKQGDIWIGTYSGDLNRFSRGKFTVYGVKQGLTGHAIWSIYPDDAGAVWIGTDGGGLLCLKEGTFSRFTTRDGLYSNLAFQVFEDRQANLWMNCNRGIYSVRKRDLEDFAAGKIQKIPCRSFGQSEGIKNTECSGPAQPAGICTEDGSLWFPTIRGAVVIEPDRIKINRTVPPIVVEAVRADGKLIYTYPSPQAGTVTLPPGQKRLEFQYTGLSFTASRQMKFKYRLEGFEEEWQEAGSQRQVSYTNIPPADYTFRVIGSNNDGTWNEEGAHFSFTLKPFFWQTWWFRLLAVVLFAFLSYMAIGFVQKHLRLIAFWKKKKYIGSYEIDEQIGSGGMGIIYKVHSLMDKSRTYALKVMREEYLLDEVQKRRFKNESMLVDRLDHPHIVKVHERGEDNGKLYIVMELLQGHTLAQRYRDHDYPDVSRGIHIMAQIAHILVTLHREEIIHRDLKPENIMLIHHQEDPDFVKLLDFGIARVQSFTHLTETGQVLGTISYMPPEVLADGSLSPAVDVYSLGIIGYEMLTQKRPFESDTPVDIIKRVIHETLPEPLSLNPQILPRLNMLLMKMTAKDPLLRPDAQTVLSILTDLQT
jgi:ligand-binding sensor domain-containing protein/tRNA A-37 threonylcarbamoyl transferase component Bud32